MITCYPDEFGLRITWYYKCVINFYSVDFKQLTNDKWHDNFNILLEVENEILYKSLAVSLYVVVEHWNRLLENYLRYG